MKASRYARPRRGVAGLVAVWVIGASAPAGASTMRRGVAPAVEAPAVEAPAPAPTEPEGPATDVAREADPEASPEPEVVDDAVPTGEAPDAPAPTEPDPSPAITVRAGAAAGADPAGKPVLEAPAQEIVADPRRRRADERILLRASAVSFGIAGAALVPMVVGLQQISDTRAELGAMPSNAERAELDRYRQQMNTLVLASGIVAGVQLVTGAVLLGVYLRGKTPRRHAVAPAIGAGRLGLVWRARF